MLAAAGLAILIGTAIGLLGGGGSILAVPALVYGVGQPVAAAVTSSLFIVGISSAVAALPRARAGQVRWPIAAVFGAAGVVTAFAGTALNHQLSARALLLGFATVMLAVAARLLLGSGPAAQTGEEPERTWSPRRVVRTLVVGAVVGFLTGLLGVGGGFLIVPALTLLLGLQMRVAIGTSLVIIAANSAAGFAAHASSGTIDWPVTLVFTAVAVAAALTAGRLGANVEHDRLRRWFAYLILAVGLFVALEAVFNPAGLRH